MKKKVFVGISGGVDSAVAAYLLQKDGNDVTGIFMKNWSGEEYGVADECPWREDLEDSIKVCRHLNIEHRTYNFEKEYRQHVMDYFFEQYRSGNTPNPDILCNKFIKFDVFLEKARSEGADLIATGHYAYTENGRLFLSNDELKDQTYFLSQLSSAQLSQSLFPLGRLDKKGVREIAEEIALPNAKKKDSQGICFVGKIELNKFLQQRIKPKEGKVVDIDSKKEVGVHSGVWFYTEGQRKGIQVGGQEQPYFVARKDAVSNTLYVAMGKSHPTLWKTHITLHSVTTISGNRKDLTSSPQKLSARIRHRGKLISIRRIEDTDAVFKLELSEPVWAPSPGQFLVFYKKNECLGSGVIS